MIWISKIHKPFETGGNKSCCCTRRMAVDQNTCVEKIHTHAHIHQYVQNYCVDMRAVWGRGGMWEGEGVAAIVLDRDGWRKNILRMALLSLCPVDWSNGWRLVVKCLEITAFYGNVQKRQTETVLSAGLKPLTTCRLEWYLNHAVFLNLLKTRGNIWKSYLTRLKKILLSTINSVCLPHQQPLCSSLEDYGVHIPWLEHAAVSVLHGIFIPRGSNNLVFVLRGLNSHIAPQLSLTSLDLDCVDMSVNM